MKHNSFFLANVLAVFVCLGLNSSASAAAKPKKDDFYAFNANYFQDSAFWTSATTAEASKNTLSFTKDNKGTIFVTPKAVNNSLEDLSSHLKSSGHYGDVVINLEFSLLPDSDIDVMLMGRYPVRLTSKKNTSGVNVSGAIGKSWEHYNPDSTERLFAGFEPIVNSNTQANKWHTFEAHFKTPRYDAAHKKVSDAFFLFVKINGEVVQENVKVPLPAVNAIHGWEGVSGPSTIDAIAGQAMLRNINISRADFGRVNLPEQNRAKTNLAELDDLVTLGETQFYSYGCGECHSVKASDTSVKTGPNLYGLFTRDGRKRWVQNQEKHAYEVRADYNYLKRSIRSADTELAIVESGAKKDQAYLPIMPRYNEQTISDKDISAIFAYLQTRNGHWQQGPVVQYETSAGPEIYEPMQDAMQFVVQNRIRIQRGPLVDVSGRSIHVGQPNGVHYSFDPRNLSVAKVWQGGFLETSGELTNRGGNGFKLGFDAIEVPFGEQDALLHPINSKGNLVDFSFKSTKFADYDTLRASAKSTLSLEQRIEEQDARFKGYFRDSTKPLSPVTFFYQVGKNDLGLTHELDEKGALTITLSGEFASEQSFKLNQFVMSDISVSSGQIIDGVWTLNAGLKAPVTLKANMTMVDTPWTPIQNDFAYESQSLQTTASEASLPLGYSIESWIGPKDNAGREQLFEAVGLDHAANGDILVSTRTAGVWRVKDGTWQLFAEGIFESLGVLSESATGDVAVVGNKAELTRIRDVNGDGIADYFDTLFDSFTNGSNYHTYTHGPVRDNQGNYVIALNLGIGKGIDYSAGGNVMASHGGYVGWAFKIAPDGSFEKFANGLRSPAGLGVDPDGNVWYADNQGDFVGSSKIFMLEKGKFYGHPAGLIDEPGMQPGSPEITWENVIDRKERAPIVVAHNRVANSLGNLVWDLTNGGFGQFDGNAFIGDQTQSTLTRINFEKVGDQWQGAMMPFGKGMESGIMRPLFLPDNSLLLGQTGRGWQAKGGNAAALQRIIYDGVTEHLAIKDTHISEDGFVLNLTQALPKALIDLSAENWLQINSWTYRDSKAYGSDELGFQSDAIQKVSISEDGKRIQIHLANPSIPDVHPQQTGRIYHIALKHELLKQFVGNSSLEAYYSAQRFK